MLLSFYRRCGVLICAMIASMALSVPSLALVLGPGTTARIDVESGSRVNVRGEAAVRADNVVGKANAGDVVTIREADDQGRYIWYRVEDQGGNYDGWVRGDLLAVIDAVVSQDRETSEIPEEIVEIPEDADDADGEAVDQASLQDEPIPLAGRADWSRYLYQNFAAISACARISSAQPSVVLRAFPMSRGMIDVIIRDARSRDWDCIVSESGGTPMRFDPLAGTALGRTSENQPFFTPLSGIMPVDNECLKTETVNEPNTGTQLGWLTYNLCE